MLHRQAGTAPTLQKVVGRPPCHLWLPTPRRRVELQAGVRGWGVLDMDVVGMCVCVGGGGPPITEGRLLSQHQAHITSHTLVTNSANQTRTHSLSHSQQLAILTSHPTGRRHALPLSPSVITHKSLLRPSSTSRMAAWFPQR